MSTAPVKEVNTVYIHVPIGGDTVDLYQTVCQTIRFLSYDNLPAPEWHNKYFTNSDEAFEAAGNKGSVTKVKAWKTSEGYFLIPSKLTKVEVK